MKALKFISLAAICSVFGFFTVMGIYFFSGTQDGSIKIESPEVEKDVNYILYSKGKGPVPLYDQKSNGTCGNIIVLYKKWGTWEHVNCGQFDSLIQVK